MEIKVAGSLAIVLMVLFVSPLTSMYIPHVAGQEIGHYEPVNITQSNESWPIMLVYEKREVFYQDQFYESVLNSSTPEELEAILDLIVLELYIENGNLTEYEESRSVYYYNRNMPSWIMRDYEIFHSRYYVIKPLELDVNFDMTLTLAIYNGSLEIYREEHVFSVIGEPEVIPGIDPNEDSNVNIVYGMSFLISLVAIMAVHRIFYAPHGKKGD